MKTKQVICQMLDGRRFESHQYTGEVRLTRDEMIEMILKRFPFNEARFRQELDTIQETTEILVRDKDNRLVPQNS